MLPSIQTKNQQIPLIHFLHKDDLILLDSADADWFRVLYSFPWQDYRSYGAEYYEALYQFNLREARKRAERFEEEENVESKEEARERLLFDRTTMQKSQGAEPSFSIRET